MIVLWVSLAVRPLAAEDVSQSPRLAAAGTDSTEVLFYDRLHETFLLLSEVALPAYLEHFRDEPEKLAVVRYYADRLAAVRGGDGARSGGAATAAPAADPNDKAPPDVWMQAALAAARRDDAGTLEYQLGMLGAQPHAVLHRADADNASKTAACPLYDPELIRAHRRLWELKSQARAAAGPRRDAAALADRQAAVQALRREPANAELSLRRFLDQNRAPVWELGWSFRCVGVEHERVGDAAAARENYLRALAIGDVLFPVAERGRADRFDRVFLAELGDVYARLGRFDLMLRYMYSEQGLPAKYEMARPVAELARVSESVRLARPAETPSELDEETLPETVSQILFEQPVLRPRAAPPSADAEVGGRRGRLGWWFIAGGGGVLAAAVAWRLIGRYTRKALAADRTSSLSRVD